MRILDKFKNRLVGFFDNRFTLRKQFNGDPNLLDEQYGLNSKDAPATITSNLIRYAYASEVSLYKDFDSDAKGLSEFQVEEKREIYGFNQVEQEKKLTCLHNWIDLRR